MTRTRRFLEWFYRDGQYLLAAGAMLLAAAAVLVGLVVG